MPGNHGHSTSSCSICGDSNSRKVGRSCAVCSRFSHLSCAKVSKRSSASIAKWKCADCLTGTGPRPPPLPNGGSEPECECAEDHLRAVAAARSFSRIPLKIPKAARTAAADALSRTIDRAVDCGDSTSWFHLFDFAVSALGLPTSRNRQISLASATKANIEAFLNRAPALLPTADDSVVFPPPSVSDPKSYETNFQKKVNAKLTEGDISAAVRVISSDDSVVHPSEEVLSALRSKHPAAPSDFRPPPPPAKSLPSVVNEEEVMLALKSFRPSSSGGIDGLRPGHLKDLTSASTAESGRRLRASLTRLCNCLIRGNIPTIARDLLFSANLTALRKKDGGIRPIAVGNTLRRLVSKVASRPVIQALASQLAPIQLGVGVQGGCEAAAHAIRSVTQRVSSPRPTGDGRILVKLDMKNAFNSIRRDHLLDVCHTRIPSLYPLAHLAYSTPSLLLASNELIESASGVQQGDPLGPLLFALAVDDIARSATSPLNIWYLDDASLGGPLDVVVKDLERMIPDLAAIGLQINPAKSEIINLDSNDEDLCRAVSAIQKIMPGAQVTNRDNLTFLGSPIHQEAISKCITERSVTLKTMSERLKTIDAHPALFLLRNCFALPRLLFVLRSAPCYTATDLLQSFDHIIRESAEAICNIRFDDIGWCQATFPVHHGGLGLRSASDIALPAYASSVYSSRSLSNEILRRFLEFSLDHAVTAVTTAWLDLGLNVPASTSRQRFWDFAACQWKATMLKEKLDQHRLACFSAASQPHSGAWLNALPSPMVGNLLDDDSVRIGVAIRLGLPICQQHRCRCGATVDRFGLHPLSCRLSAGRIPRHYALNDVIKRALNSAGFHSILEPVGLDRGDGKRPDGLTVFPFEAGKSLIWDATCSDTFAPSALLTSASDPGSAARVAEERKVAKYSSLSTRYIFQPVAIETSGVLGPRTLSFLKRIGHKLFLATSEPREAQRLFERVSLAVLRGNSLAILSAPSSTQSYCL